MIGERINPTGKKRFQQALREQDLDYIVARGLEQQDAGADILDVNVGLPGIDEPAMMARTVKALQAVIDLPLQIDSSNPEAIGERQGHRKLGQRQGRESGDHFAAVQKIRRQGSRALSG